MFSGNVKEQLLLPWSTLSLRQGSSNLLYRSCHFSEREYAEREKICWVLTLIETVSPMASPLTASSNASNILFPTILPAPTSNVAGSFEGLELSKTSPSSLLHVQCKVTMSPSTALSGDDPAAQEIPQPWLFSRHWAGDHTPLTNITVQGMYRHNAVFAVVVPSESRLSKVYNSPSSPSDAALVKMPTLFLHCNGD